MAKNSKSNRKNDFYLKRLSFGQTKNDEQELINLIHKWDNLLNKSTLTDDKTLQKVIQENFG